MQLKGRLVLEDRVIPGYVEVQNGRIAGVSETPFENQDIKDYGELFIMPGIVDLHTHGSGGFDFMDGEISDIEGAARSLAVHGTTTCLPTTLTSADSEMLKFFSDFRDVHARQQRGELWNLSKMPGLHLEGPYFNPGHKGAQNPKYIVSPRPEHYNMFLEAAGGLVRRWSVAPEVPGAMAFIDDMVKNGILVSAAHTSATYEDVSRAVDHGLSLLTHFYCGMSSITKHDGYKILGVVESGYLIDDLNIEIIFDGSHLLPELLRLIFKCKDHRHIIGCSDSMRGAGMPEGPSILGPKRNGTACVIEDGIAKLPDHSSFAGSVATGDRLARTLHCIMGLGMDEVSRMLCLQPAKLAGLASEIGSIEAGKCADLLVCDENINVKEVYLDGRPIL